MSGTASQEVPSNREEWEFFVKERKLEGKTIHGAELASGSKIGYDQYLLLRIIWVEHLVDVSFPERISKLLPKAAEMLAQFPSWKTYCDSFSKKENPEGSFAVARHYQQMAANSRGNIRPNSFETPIALRTRSKRNNKVPDISKLQLNPSKTPQKKQTKPPETPVISSSDDDLIADDEESFPQPLPITPAAQAPEELQSLMYPPTKDEQIVNTALVIFLNVLTIYFDNCKTCNWTLYRKRFIANFTKASFEARIDGYLDDGQENAYALIEVKPITRGKK
ncbi:hypothetical protein P175DRAFT_0163601 [Aspergillus ochraceoroseus IBT 24754]|uniref:Uncharacterized protein n=2 Tax=Aspergillus ochraceoroseus TaxID=138278 RepID=A0A2T5M3W3_9EURO|nr:uncharacterized protein P175DRAFT_0163601 [Aspergillus ochraceoroseus IBT 24754]KKK12765.1 hypothetical protein AOCH_002547 [Aspergillus ochraceoroseus]PTU23202.1 hypothetical protein P175DRAFT_0163601 [Aspergillus ochraceoroseus IBT 24754]